MKILVIDNYDSFVFNLVHMLYQLNVDQVDVIRNDKIDISQLGSYQKILLSPGPGKPYEASNLISAVKAFTPGQDLLGVCLGHQAIVESFGGTLKNLEEPLHGVASSITVKKDDYLFSDIPVNFSVGHYHSWIVGRLPDDLEIIAVDPMDSVMAIRHRKFNIRGIQFHPESVLSEYGKTLIKNWVNNSE